MVTIASLWLSILLAAVLVFIGSALIWMALPHHRSDFKGLPDEASVLGALGTQNLAPGQYDFPHTASHADLKKPEVRQRFTDGPIGFFTVKAPGVPGMGKPMALSLIYYIVIGAAVAYLASRTLARGAPSTWRCSASRARSRGTPTDWASCPKRSGSGVPGAVSGSTCWMPSSTPA